MVLVCPGDGSACAAKPPGEDSVNSGPRSRAGPGNAPPGAYAAPMGGSPDRRGSVPAPELGEAVRVWAGIGVNSFGGPAGQISVMHRELVDERGWLDEHRFTHALGFCMALPGPEAQQLATYSGWLVRGVRGGLLAGTLFVLPGALVMLVLSAVYALYGGIGWVSALLFGLQAAVVPLVFLAVQRMSSRTLRTPMLRLLAVLAFGALVVAVPFPIVVAAAGLVGWAVGRGRPGAIASEPPPGDDAPDDPVPPAAARGARRAAAACALLWLLPVGLLVWLRGTDDVFTEMALLFSTAAVVTFGGAYAVLGFVANAAVETFGWISPEDMAVGLGLAETTPGPLILVLQFVGFLAAHSDPGGLPPLLAGVLGAGLALWVTFLPCFAFVFAGAPFVERIRHSPAVRDALAGIGAAVVGVIAHLGLWFTGHVLFETFDGPVPELGSVRWDAVALVILAGVLLLWRQARPLTVLAVSAAAGLALALATGQVP